MNKKLGKRIYLDNAATTPVDSRVEKAMASYFALNFANPSAIYKEGVGAQKAMENARKDIAGVLEAHSDEIVFTSGGTEANNLAILGLVKNYTGKDRPHIVTTQVEHQSVLNVCSYLEKAGLASVSYVGVNKDGIVDPKEIKKGIKKNTILVSVIYANNEIGSVQPVKEIVKTVRHFRKHQKSATPYFHIDACQAINYLNVNVGQLGIDMMTFNGSKIYGPKGVGVLYLKRGVELAPVVYGGGQEEGLRSGTENMPAIIGISEAIKISEKIKGRESSRLSKLRDYFIDQVLKKVIGSELNGSIKDRLSNNANFSFPDIESQLMVIELDARGIAVSAKSACSSEDEESSYVVDALGKGKNFGETSVRFSLGRDTSKKDIDGVVKAILDIYKKYSNI